MVNGFVCLFTETPLVTWIVLGVSLACLIGEVFIPSFGLVGAGGLVLAVAGIVANTAKPWLSTLESIWLAIDTLLIFAVIVGTVKICHTLVKKKQAKSPKAKEFLEIDGKKIPADRQGNPNFSFLKGKAGTCVTDLKPSGKVEIDGEVYNCLSQKDYLYNGNMVRVIKTVGSSIYVEKIPF